MTNIDETCDICLKYDDYKQELISLLHEMKDLAQNWQENRYEVRQMEEKAKNIVRKGILELISGFLPGYSIRIEGDLEFNHITRYFDAKTGRWIQENKVQFVNDLWVSHVFKGNGKYRWINKMCIFHEFSEQNIIARTDANLITFGSVVHKLIVDEIDTLRYRLEKEFGDVC